ncbi:protein kinase domain-containing protein [Pseudorhodoferax sp.]|uniref:protein kinase domain-containing protein n=1 Tax=Pseudorhodoferax sp. TaxID=1993553 RepID=UPI0039E702D9
MPEAARDETLLTPTTRDTHDARDATGAPAAPAAPDLDATRIAPASPAPHAPLTHTRTATRGTGLTLPGGGPGAEPEVRQVGRYRILDKLGRGGMATVFKAHDPDIGRDVAIKFLHASLCEDEEYRARFLREARAAGGLSHPHIVTVHDVGEIDGRPYMAMELLDGEPLADLLQHGRPLPVRDVVVMGIQLAQALDYAHGRGIVHRDIKPGNIARLRGAQGIKVMDFGIAHMAAAAGEQRTRVGDVLGTPQYMSPEQMEGGKVDGRSDLFSAGIVLYQALTGQRPFNGDSVVTLALKIAKEDPAPIEKLRPDAPASLRRVIDRCLAKAPGKRHQSGAALAEALQKVLAEIDEQAREGAQARGGVPLRLKWAGLMALIVAVVMGIASAVIVQRQQAALMAQVGDTGAALARFIAAQNAVAALGEDWVVVDVALQQVMQTRDFDSLTVVDRSGTVRAASRPELVGQPWHAPAGEALGAARGVQRTRYLAGGEPVLGFTAPILFQGKPVGQVALGLPEKPLAAVARLSMGLMAVLAVVTVLAVALAMYLVATWFARPVRLVGEAMDEIAAGRLDFRIAEQRNDEFGQLYAAFDRMAQALQQRAAAPATADAAAAPVPTTTAEP